MAHRGLKHLKKKFRKQIAKKSCVAANKTELSTELSGVGRKSPSFP